MIRLSTILAIQWVEGLEQISVEYEKGYLDLEGVVVVAPVGKGRLLLWILAISCLSFLALLSGLTVLLVGDLVKGYANPPQSGSWLTNKQSIGFGAPLPKPQLTSTTLSSNAIAPPLTPTTPDLQTYGLIPEFLGRLPILTTLSPLSLSDLVRILTEPRNALIKQYTALFDKYGSELGFTQKAIREVAVQGEQKGGGARGLRGVLEGVLGDAMFEVPGSVSLSLTASFVFR